MYYVHVYDDNSETPDVCGPFTSEAEASEFVSKQTLSVSAVIVEADSLEAAVYKGD